MILIPNDFLLDTIEIQIYTNISKKDISPTIFTINTLKYLPNYGPSLNEYPYFTSEYRIPVEAIKKLSYDDKIITLFNKSQFIKMLRKNGTIFKDNDNDKSKNIEYNIKSILELLFQTYYPIKDNIVDTYSEFIEQKYPLKHIFSSIIPYKWNKYGNNNNNNLFSYLNIDSKSYTVIKVFQLNDFINNPKYYKLLVEFNKYKKWKETKKNELENDILNKKKDIIILINEMKKYYFNNNKNDNKICDLFNSFIDQYDNYIIYGNIYLIHINNIYKLLKYIIHLFGINNINDNNRDIFIKQLKQCNNLKYKNNDSFDSLIKEYNLANRNKNRSNSLTDNDKNIIDKYKHTVNNTYNEYIYWINKIEEIYDISTKNLNNYIRFPSIFLQNFNSIINKMKDLYTIENINTKFFNEDININIIDEDIKKYFDNNYKEYNTFFDIVRSYLPPNRESGNTILSDYIYEFVDGEPNNLNKYLENITNIIKGTENINYAELYLPFDKLNKPISNKSKYGIQIYIELFEGELTKDIVDNISCELKDDELVNIYNKLKYNDITTSPLIMEQNPINSIISYNTTNKKLKVGGKKNTRKQNGYHRIRKYTKTNRKYKNTNK